MDDMDAEAEELGGQRSFLTGPFEHFGWVKLMRSGSVIDETARKLIKRLLRENRLEKDGDSIRRV